MPSKPSKNSRKRPAPASDASAIHGGANPLLPKVKSWPFSSYQHGTILHGMVAVAAFGLAAKVLGALKEVAIAWRYGTEPIVDAYIFSFNLLTTPVTIWYSAIFAVTVPLYVRLAKGDPEQERLFRRQFVGTSTLLSIGVAVLMVAGLTWFTASGAAGLGPASDDAVAMILLMGPIIPLLFLTHYGSTRLIASRRHVNTFYEGLPALAILIAVLSIEGKSFWPLVIGTLAGVGAQFLFTLFSLSRLGPLLFPKFGWSAQSWVGLWSALLAIITSQALQAMCAVLDVLIAARLESGDLAVFGYSNRLIALVLTLGATAIGRAMLPVLSDLKSGDSDASFRQVVAVWAGIVVVMGVLAALCGSLLASQLIALIFERGAFTSDDTTEVAAITQILLWQIPFSFLAMVLMQAHFSEANYRLLVLMGIGSVLVKLATGIPLAYSYGLEGLAISVVLVLIFQGSFLTISFFRTRTILKGAEI